MNSTSTPRMLLQPKVQFGSLSTLVFGEKRWGMKEARFGEGPWLTRLLLVLSSMSPLFVLWIIRGTSVMPENEFRALCIAMIVLPNAFLGWFYWRASRRVAPRTIVVGEVDDRRQDIVAYLFAMLLPFYAADLTTWPDFWSTAVAFTFVVILFVVLNLHYMNFIFAIFGYHCIQVHTPKSVYSASSEDSFLVITRNRRLRSGSYFTGYEISPTVLFEVPPWKLTSTSNT